MIAKIVNISDYREVDMPQIVSIHSFRGGTGKSNTTANAAAQVAMRGNRVGVVDTDIQSPGIHVLFNMGEEEITTTLNDYLWGKCEIVDAAYDVSSKLTHVDGTVEEMDGKLYLVPSSIKPGEIAKVLREGYDVGLLNDGFHDLIEDLELDYLFIDTHPGLNEETLLSIAISDVLIIILRPDKQDFQGTAVTVDVARKLEVPNLYLVVNKCLTRYDFEQVRKDVSALYEAIVATVLPLSEDIVELASGGIFSIMHPEHRFSEGIQETVELVLSAG